MENLLAYLKEPVNKDWFIGYNSDEFLQLSEQFFSDLRPQTNRKAPLKVLLVESEQFRFLAAFLAAVTAGCSVFLGNPNWVEQEWQDVFELVQPDVILGNVSIFSQLDKNKKRGKCQIDNRQQILIPTGGSSGNIRFAIHTWETLMASVYGFKEYFQLNSINSFCVLPLYHVSGLMQFMRSVTTGGQLRLGSFKSFQLGEYLNLNPEDFFISLVPTQLQRCLENPQLTDWLSQFKTVLLGGAPAWAELLEQARFYNIPLALTYGMTETASQVVTLKPKDFLKGNNSSGQVLPHAKITIRNSLGEILGANQTGRITIESNSLALGYYPGESLNSHADSFSKIPRFQSDDLGFFDEQGYLKVIGRCSNKIITGGENVFPAEVEAAILATQLVADVAVIGLPDNYWGEVVTAIYVPRVSDVSSVSLKTAIAEKISKFKQPKYWIPVERLPRNEQGKINHEKLKTLATQFLNTAIGSST
ncbi:MAG TPA: 2-succinylbenzoate--CoA ligase [Cyanophyceae cyanobacterium]